MIEKLKQFLLKLEGLLKTPCVLKTRQPSLTLAFIHKLQSVLSLTTMVIFIFMYNNFYKYNIDINKRENMVL